MIQVIHTINIILPICYLATLAAYFFDFLKEEKKLTEEKKNLEKETVDIKIIQERLKKLNEKK